MQVTCSRSKKTWGLIPPEVSNWGGDIREGDGLSRDQGDGRHEVCGWWGRWENTSTVMSVSGDRTLEPPACLSKHRGMVEWPFQKYVCGSRMKGVGWGEALPLRGHCICDMSSPWNIICSSESTSWDQILVVQPHVPPNRPHGPCSTLCSLPAARKAKSFVLCCFSNPHRAESEESRIVSRPYSEVTCFYWPKNLPRPSAFAESPAMTWDA